MLGSKVSFFGTRNGNKLWETTALPFSHPVTGEQVDIVYTAEGSMIVSPEKAADIREESIKDFEPGVRHKIFQVVTPDEI